MKTLTVFIIRVLPILYVLAVLLNVNLNYFDVYQTLIRVVDSLFGIGFIGLVALWILSKTYKFCVYHRMFIYFLFINKLVVIYDINFGIKLDDLQLYYLYITMIGITCFAALILYLVYGDRNTKKNEKLQ